MTVRLQGPKTRTVKTKDPIRITIRVKSRFLNSPAVGRGYGYRYEYGNY
jgi:hypothetical protein